MQTVIPRLAFFGDFSRQSSSSEGQQDTSYAPVTKSQHHSKCKIFNLCLVGADVWFLHFSPLILGERQKFVSYAP